MNIERKRFDKTAARPSAFSKLDRFYILKRLTEIAQKVRLTGQHYAHKMYIMIK